MSKGRGNNKFVKRGEILEILIKDYAFGGKGIGKIQNEHGEFVIFVQSKANQKGPKRGNQKGQSR